MSWRDQKKVSLLSGSAVTAAVTVADGADVAQGTTTDSAWVSGAGTVIALLKKIASAGGSAVSIADGADVAQGTTSDAAWVSGSGTVIALLKKIAAGGGGSAVTVADGADVTQGALADAAVSTDAAGTLNAHLRGIVKLLAAGIGITNANLDVALSTRTKPADQQHVIVDTMTPALALDATVNGLLKPASTLAAVTAVTGITNPVAVTNAGLTNLDVALSTRLKPADTLTKVTTLDTITNPVTVKSAIPLFQGRVSTFRTPGRAGTAGQKILSLHNATGSSIKVFVTFAAVDLVQTVIKAVTVLPPVVRLWKVTVLPTNGTALTKNRTGGSTTSSASVTALGDASADGTGSGTTLTATLPAGTILTQEFAPRFITAAGYEPADRIEFLNGETVELDALEGVVLFLDYTLATQNPTTDMWIATLGWYEST